MAQQLDSADDYIDSFPPEVRTVLQAARKAIHAATPDLKESISYGIPTFTVDGRPVVYLGGWKKHISIYPIPERYETLQSQLAPYLSGKGTAKFSQADPVRVDHSSGPATRGEAWLGLPLRIN